MSFNSSNDLKRFQRLISIGFGDVKSPRFLQLSDRRNFGVSLSGEDRDSKLSFVVGNVREKEFANIIFFQEKAAVVLRTSNFLNESQNDQTIVDVLFLGTHTPQH
jgi:hypothetical protein